MKVFRTVRGAAWMARRGGLVAAMLLWAVTPASAQAGKELADLSLDELAGIQVTSVSKRQERLGDAPASIFVITREDIRRAGVVSLPEALRLAPNLQVARVDARNYAVTSRGFNSAFENKLLVLVDGRSIYTPLFSGVFWDAQDVVLEDIERIEVISGAGATLWGANAVNGVINVITRASEATQGDLVSIGGSGQDRVLAGRHGGALGGGLLTHYRVDAKLASGDDTQTEGGRPAFDGWRRSQATFRADGGEGADQLALQGGVYTARLHQSGTRDIHLDGFNLVGRAARRLSGGSDLKLQVYWDHTWRDQPGAFAERLDTLDAELQQSIALGASHQVVWGASYRLGMDRLRGDVGFAFLPLSLDMRSGSVFAQDEMTLSPEVKITAGWKLEHNGYTGLESMPSLRIAWKPAAEHLWWASASRAVRAPSRIDRDLYAPTNPPVVNGVPQYVLAGGPDFQSEVANTFELGYRGQLRPGLSYSTTVFHSEYNRLRTLELNRSGSGLVFGNQATGRVRGIEMWGQWQALPAWRVSGGLVAQQVQVNYKPGATLSAAPLDDTDPHHHWTLRVSGDLSSQTEVDITLRRVGQLRRPAVPAYQALDLRWGWRIRRGVALSVVGQNLLDGSHPEFGNYPNRSEFERGVFVKLVWQP